MREIPQIKQRRGAVRPVVPKRPPKRRPRNGAFFGFVIVVIIVYLIGYFYHNAARPEVSQMRVEMGAAVRPTSFRGVVVRDEVVYQAVDAGALVFHTANHERVRRGDVVASVQDAGIVELYRANLARLDQDAVEAQRRRGGLAMNEEEIARRNRGIAQTVNQAVFELSAGNLEVVFALGDRVRLGMESRNELYFSGEAAIGAIDLAREQAISGISGAVREVAVQQSGVLSVAVDGLEGVASIANLAALPQEVFYSERGMDLPQLNVGAGDDIFRVVRSNDWYIAAYLPEEYVAGAGLSVGAGAVLYVEIGGGLLPLTVQVYRLVDRGREFYVVFQTNRDMMRFIDTRHVVFQLTQNAREGFKIPWTAIVERGRFPVPEEFVFMQGGVNAVNLRIGEGIRTESVLGFRSACRTIFYIMADASGLRVGDELVGADGSFSLESIETVPGVLVTNIGATQFRAIDLEGNFAQNADYVILDPARNRGIRLFDRIVADARNVPDRFLLH